MGRETFSSASAVVVHGKQRRVTAGPLPGAAGTDAICRVTSRRRPPGRASADGGQPCGQLRNNARCSGLQRAHVDSVTKGGSSIVAMFCDCIQYGP